MHVACLVALGHEHNFRKLNEDRNLGYAFDPRTLLSFPLYLLSRKVPFISALMSSIASIVRDAECVNIHGGSFVVDNRRTVSGIWTTVIV